jgi:hypothetical protein
MQLSNSQDIVIVSQRVARMHAGVVIASGAKQSISPRKERMDCFAEPVIGREQPVGQISPVGWVEPFAKPIIFANLQLMGIASLHPSYALLIFSGQPALPVNQEAARRETAAFSTSDATFKQPRHRHCEPTGRANARRGRHCERSEAIHLTAQRKNGLLRRYAPRNDDALSWI